jgi:hypothetical protein
MTKPAPATQAQIKRAIAAAQSAGLRVRGIRPDGVIITDETVDLVPALAPDSAPSKWEDAGA